MTSKILDRKGCRTYMLTASASKYYNEAKPLFIEQS